MKIRTSLLIVSVFVFSLSVKADDYHYKEVIVGERASGLGGSFIAISDDPSGLWYNPAGIIFSFENYFSLSANAYTETNEVYKNVFKNGNYTYKSKGLVPNFFGFTQSYKDYKWGFAVVVPKSELFDQDDEVLDISSNAGSAKSLKRKYFRQNNVTGVGFGGAAKIRDGLTFGISFFGLFRDEKIIDNQLIAFNIDSQSRERFFILNRSIARKTFSYYPKLGLQYMHGKNTSIGLTVAKLQHISGEVQNRFYSTNTAESATEDDGKPNDIQYDLSKDIVTPSSTDPIKAFELSPLEVGIGVAYFPTKYLMYTMDLNYYSADSEFKEFVSVDTVNASLGLEYFLSDKKAIRIGLYTNNANTAKLDSNKKNQAPNVDMLGATLSYSLFSSGSALTFGGIYSTGNGKGQVIGDISTQQDIQRQSMTFYLTGSYQM